MASAANRLTFLFILCLLWTLFCFILSLLWTTVRLPPRTGQSSFVYFVSFVDFSALSYFESLADNRLASAANRLTFLFILCFLRTLLLFYFVSFVDNH